MLGESKRNLDKTNPLCCSWLVLLFLVAHTFTRVHSQVTDLSDRKCALQVVSANWDLGRNCLARQLLGGLTDNRIYTLREFARYVAKANPLFKWLALCLPPPAWEHVHKFEHLNHLLKTKDIEETQIYWTPTLRAGNSHV